jgi:DNA polymerase-1
MAVVWDSPGKTLRHEVFEHYKATRQAPPSDLFEQKKHINEFNKLIGLHEISKSGVEADDLMYSLGQDLRKQGFDVVLITSDKDMGQMIEEHIFIYDSFKDILYDEQAFQEKMGIPVAKLPFYFALLGDSSDNIPGVHGIGQKGAIELVTQFNSLEDMYAHLHDITKQRMRNALEQNRENAFLSYQLFLLKYYQLNVAKNDLIFDQNSWQKARSLFEQLNFQSLIKELPQQHAQTSFLDSSSVAQGAMADVQKKKPINYLFKKVTTEEQLNELIKELQTKRVFALDTETTGLNPMTDPVVGISFATEVGTACYVPFGHNVDEKQLSKEYVLNALKPILEDASIKKYLHHASFDKAVLWHAGIDLKGITFDTLLAAKLTNKGWQKSGLKDLSEYYFDEQMWSYDQVVKGNGYKNFSQVPLDLATEYAAADAHQTLKLQAVLKDLLVQEEQQVLFEAIEQPLQEILFDMQERGVYLDKGSLAALGKHVTAEMIEIEDEIIRQAGPSYAGINLNSPKQVEQLLFHELKLTPQKKSAKGSFSTDSQVLLALAHDHPIPGLIARYRELAKLKSTYIDALPEYVNPKTGHIHTHFNQTAVATGRLSSFDPNMQNIPADSGSYGIEVRAAFKPAQGYLFLSADYSQIELRVLAYLSQDRHLLEAFEREADIHTETAARLFNVPVVQVTQQQRQIGKRINFSVLYGLTPYGLSKDLGIPFKDAKLYIDTYFEQYPGVREWMDKVIEEVKSKGYVTTLYGRRRYVPAIYESNHALYQEAVRVAINTVAQGTAAEIMKIGMIQLVKAFRQHNIDAHLLLQIHDELLISVHSNEQKAAEMLTKNMLEGIVNWNVPLRVTTRYGHTWKDVTK